MSWYLANEHGLLDQFASISGLRDLRTASLATSYPALSDFFEVGATKNIAMCIAELGGLAKATSDADVKSTAEGLAKLLAGETLVFITQGFAAADDAETPVRESLKHPAHAAVLDPIRTTAKAVLARFFKRQRALFVKTLGPALKTLALRETSQNWDDLREASDESDAAKAAVQIALPDGTALPNAVTAAMAVDFTTVLESALTGGYDSLASESQSTDSISADVTATFLRERSLETLASQLEPTTVSRIQTALADAYEAGEDYDGLVEAVRAEFDDMANARAGTIAQTAMNSAYNAGRKQLGVDLGFDEKSWSCDGPNPCEECLANQDEGWIGMDETFPDGSDMPVGHPGCYCSLDVRASAEALAA
jgi:hypothetical protein